MNRRLIPIAVLALMAATSAAQSPAPRKSAPAHSSRTYEINIEFRRIYHGKLRTDKTYTLLATAGETLPALRDDARFRTDATLDDAAHTIEGATDVDILSLKPQGRTICLGLKISMKTHGNDVPEYLPKLPEQGTHQYLITPTIPLGKQLTVYRSSDATANTSVEVQLLVKPFDTVRGEALR